MRAVAFSPDDKTLATGDDDNQVRLWDVATGKVRLFKGHASEVRTVAFSPDGKTLASGGGDGTVRLWNVGANDAR